ncbi:MAG TPA: insulinase family protein [Allosphingosinicella sp.]|jgi:predicted Zn-dependent peptidase
MQRKFKWTTAAIAAAALGACAHGEQGPLKPQAAATVNPSGLRQVEIVSETLPNGFKVVLAKTPPVEGQEPRAYVASYILHGVLQERTLGWAHLMEHVATNNAANVKGPPPVPGAKVLDSNAVARLHYTSFLLIVTPDLLPTAIHGRMAKAGHTQDDPKVFPNEVGRVLAELERDGTSQYPAYSALAALAGGKRPGLKPELDSVRSADQATVRAMMTELYRPDRAVLVVVGDIDLAAARAAVRESAAKLGWPASRPSPTKAKLQATKLRTGLSAVLPDQNRGESNIVGLGWPKPALGERDQLPLLVADQILLGGRDDPATLRRSDDSPFGRRLGQRLGAEALWDRIDSLATPPLADIGTALQVVLFNSKRDTRPDEVRREVRASLAEIRAEELSDTAIEAAKAKLAAFYEAWLLEPRHRTLGEHLMAYYATGRSPEQVKDIPDRIRKVRPADVRAAFQRRLQAVEPLVVILPRSPAAAAAAN